MKSFISKIDNVSTLFATLPQQQINQLTIVIKDALQLNAISLKELIKQLSSYGVNSNYFAPLKNYFSQLFGQYNQTILNDNNHIIIGYGLDLTQNPNAIALFYALDPTQDWETILSQPGQPIPPLTSTQLSELFYLSLIGVKNKNGTFPGYLMQLDKSLNKFANTSYMPNQLFGLASLAALNNGSFPSTLQLALNTYNQTNNDLTLIETIIDYSNYQNDISMQNLLLSIAAMTHGNVTDPTLDVHITYRQSQRLIESNRNSIFNISNGPIKWGIPIGEWQQTFAGLNNSFVFPSVNPNNKTNDSVYLGTPFADNFKATGLKSGIAYYTGDGNDTIEFIINTMGQNPNHPDVVYMAGGNGFDIYKCYFDEPQWVQQVYSAGIKIYDVDRNGKISVNYPYQFDLSGIVVDGQIMFGSELNNVTEQIEVDGTTSLLISSPTRSIQVMDYMTPQFSLIPNGGSKTTLYQIPDQNCFPALFGVVSNQGYAAVNQDQNIIVYNITNGKMLNNISIPMYYEKPFPPMSGGSIVSNYLGDTYFSYWVDNSSIATVSYYQVTPDMKILEPNVIDYAYSNQMFSAPNIFSFSTGDIGVVYSQYVSSFQYSLKYSLNGNPPIIIANISSQLGSNVVWPIIEDGFMVDVYPSLGNETALIFDIKGQLTQSLDMGYQHIYNAQQINNDEFIWIVNNGSFSNGQATYSQIYNIYSGGGPKLYSYCGLFNDKLNLGNTMSLLNDGKFIYLQNCHESFIINQNNTFYANNFDIVTTSKDTSWLCSTTLPNGDVIALANAYDLCELSSYYLKTSLLTASNKANDEQRDTLDLNHLESGRTNYLSRKLLSIDEIKDEVPMFSKYRQMVHTSGANELSSLFSITSLLCAAKSISQGSKGILSWLGSSNPPKETFNKIPELTDNNITAELAESPYPLSVKSNNNAALVKQSSSRVFITDKLSGVVVKTAELPCYYPDKTTNIKTTTGAQPESALLAECKLPKENLMPVSFSDGLQHGAQAGSTAGFLTQLFIDQGMSQQEAEFAAEGATVATLFALSPACAALYFFINRIPTEQLGTYGKPVKQVISTTISGAASLYSGSSWWNTGKHLMGNFFGHTLGAAMGSKVAGVLATTPELKNKLSKK